MRLDFGSWRDYGNVMSAPKNKNFGTYILWVSNAILGFLLSIRYHLNSLALDNLSLFRYQRIIYTCGKLINACGGKVIETWFQETMYPKQVGKRNLNLYEFDVGNEKKNRSYNNKTRNFNRIT